MTLEEAIRLKELTGDEFLAADPDDLDEADSLSIEALKAVIDYHGGADFDCSKLLPGETTK